VWQTSLVNPDFAEYATLCGATGIPVLHSDGLDDGMKALFAADGPAILHVHADAELV
jgi:thiamine pyrophosphate-dependent acetolactate synthase large subunit-like protein